MKPIFITVGAMHPLMIIPDTEAHVDGHPVLTYTYSVYGYKKPVDQQLIDSKESKLLLDKKNDPDYLGTITFELPGKIFSYEANDGQELTPAEVQEAIQQIMQYRETPGMWQI